MAESGGTSLEEWRQGDFALSDVPLPIVSTDDGDLAVIYADDFPGFAVISQSCDIIRSPEDKPYVQVALLVRLPDGEMAGVQRGARPRYGYIPGAAKLGLAVDLDITATVDKEVIASLIREEGCTSDDERRAFAEQLARHRARFAFPDDYNQVVKPIRRWIEGKRSAASPAGDLVRAIQEVRVVCDSWDVPTNMEYLLIVDQRLEPDVEASWYKAIAALENREVPAPYPKPSFRIACWDDISAREYLQSDRLDFDGLSDA